VFFFFFFFKQKTAYEMVGSDWSSDVCSSDLTAWVSPKAATLPSRRASRWVRSEERRVGKECTNRVDLGGRRIIKKKKKKKNKKEIKTSEEHQKERSSTKE